MAYRWALWASAGLRIQRIQVDKGPKRCKIDLQWRLGMCEHGLRHKMRLLFNPRKAAQAAAYLVKSKGGTINVLSLVKLLYLADRVALVESGYTITGDKMVSMPHGTVLSRVLDSIDWESGDDDPWRGYISERTDNAVSLADPTPEFDELSQYETEVLDRIIKEYGHLTPSQLRRLTHELPEYQDPDGSSLPIEPVTILRAVGKSEAEIRDATQDAEAFYLTSRLLKKVSAR